MLIVRKNFFVYLFIFFPVAFYLLYAFTNSGSLFYADDFHLLKTVLWVQEADGFFDKFAVLLKQHNEHRIVIPRLLTWLDYQIEGFINWKTLILAGNLLWVGNLFFFWKASRFLGLPAWMFVAIPFIFLQPQYSDNVTWSISILQQSVIVFWFSLLVYLCVKKQFRLALVVAVVATFTHGNGIFSFLIGIMFALMEKRKKMALVWFTTWILTGVVYFWHFERGQNADFMKSLSNPVGLVGSFFSFFGALSQIRFSSTNLSMFLGLFMFVVLGLYLIPRLIRFFKGEQTLSFFDKLLIGNGVFLIITGSLVCISRGWAGVENLLAPRYVHYSPFLFCWVYLILLKFISGDKRQIFALLFTGVAILISSFSYFKFNEEIQFRKNWLVADESNWYNHGVMLNYAESFNSNFDQTYQRVVANGICQSRETLVANPENSLMDTVSIGLNYLSFVKNEVDAFASHPHTYQEISNDTLRGNTFIFLKPKDGSGYWLPTWQTRSGIREFFKGGYLQKPGFKASFLTENLPSGQYQIGLLNGGEFRWTTEHLVVP